MKKPTVIITKASPWKYAKISKNHPEYSAISKIIERHSEKISFVLTGTTASPAEGFELPNKAIAWDFPTNGIIGLLKYYIQLIRLFIIYKPRLIIVLGLTTIVPALAFSFLSFRCKCVPIFIGEFNYHGRKHLGKLLNFAQFKIMSLVLKISQTKMPKMFALSESVSSSITRMAPNLKNRIYLISYPISSNFRLPSEKRTPPNKPTLLTVAGIEPRKGLDVLIKAVSNLRDKPRVIIKGQVRDPIYMHELVELTKSLSLQDTIEFHTNPVDEETLISYYHSSTIFVFPTKDDSLGVVVLEALFSGLPVISTIVGGVPDMIKNGVNGILLKPNDPVELSKAIKKLVEDKDLQNRLSNNSILTLRSYYANRISLENALEEAIKTI